MTLNRARYKDYGKNDDYNRKYKKNIVTDFQK